MTIPVVEEMRFIVRIFTDVCQKITACFQRANYTEMIICSGRNVHQIPAALENLPHIQKRYASVLQRISEECRNVPVVIFVRLQIRGILI